jgi:hypothetical protein
VAGIKGRSGRKPGYSTPGWRLRDPVNEAAQLYGNMLELWLATEPQMPDAKRVSLTVRRWLAKRAIDHTLRVEAMAIGQGLQPGPPTKTINVGDVLAKARKHVPANSLRKIRTSF